MSDKKGNLVAEPASQKPNTTIQESDGDSAKRQDADGLRVDGDNMSVDDDQVARESFNTETMVHLMTHRVTAQFKHLSTLVVPACVSPV